MCMTQMVLGEGKALVGGLALVRSRIEAVCGYQRQVDITMPWQDPPSVTRALVLGICIKKKRLTFDQAPSFLSISPAVPLRNRI